jgi:hypothetical protein
VLVALAAAAALAVPASADDLPAGFTDGVAVGDGDGADRPPLDGEAPERAEPDERATSVSSNRWFGREPWTAIGAAARAAPRPCAVGDDVLTALAVAPVFKESSAATSASTAPSPMTLSRYDEWTGATTPDTNRNANYGLYAFRDPSTAYRRAFWHPGIGIWQYDSAGVGAPFTAIERMDVRVVAADVIAGMAARWCNPSASLIGHPAPFTAAERRAAAWAPWGYPCTACEQEYQAMLGGAPFANISLVDGISATGGAQARTCTLPDTSAPFRCWYIDPSVGVIEGATAWATLDPSGGSPTVAPTPLARPFYVFGRGGSEERHWLREDTGYRIEISARRLLGRNARPRVGQEGSGLDWRSASGLCDLTTSRGACLPQPPPGINLATASATGTYRPLALDADGDGRGDVLWYAPGAAPDPLWLGRGAGRFDTVGLVVSASYDHVLAGDLDGDGADDVLWYSSATGSAFAWIGFDGSRYRSVRLDPGRGRRPVLVDRDGDGVVEILWYGPGARPDHWSIWDGSGFRSLARTVSGTYLPLVGDFDGDGRDDIFWYAPGPGPDALWLHTGSGAVRNVAVNVVGSYFPLVGDFDGDGRDDIFWYAPGPTADSMWWGAPNGAFDRSAAAVTTVFTPIVVDLEGDGRDDLIWYQPGPGRDTWWRWSPDRRIVGGAVDLPTRHQPVVGAFSSGGSDGVLWYQPGPVPEGVWWR